MRRLDIYEICNKGECYNQGGAYPYPGKKTWILDDIQNTNYRVTGWIDKRNNPELDVYVENKDGSQCDGMNCPVIFHL